MLRNGGHQVHGRAALEVPRDHQGGVVLIGMKADPIGYLQSVIQEEVYVIFVIINQTKYRNRSSTQAQVAFHSVGRGKGYFTLLQTLLQIPDVQFAIVL